jgi:hypothetical protein
MVMRWQRQQHVTQHPKTGFYSFLIADDVSAVTGRWINSCPLLLAASTHLPL